MTRPATAMLLALPLMQVLSLPASAQAQSGTQAPAQPGAEATAPAPAATEPRVALRVGDHPTHGRVVFDWPRPMEYTATQEAGRLVLRFRAPGAFDLAAARRPPRNIRAIEAAGNEAVFTLAPGSRARHFRLGNRIVVDVLNPASEVATAAPPVAPPVTPPAAAAQPVASARAPAPSRTAAQRPAPVAAEAPVPPMVQPAARPAPRPIPSAEPVPRAAPLVPVTAEALPPVAARAAAPPVAAPSVAVPPVVAPSAVAVRLLTGPGIAVPSPADTGAALLRRGATWLMVLDAPIPLDIAALRANPLLAGAETSTGQQATTLRLPADAFAEPRLRREGNAWLLDAPRTASGEPTALRSITAEVEAGPPPRLLLRSPRANASVGVVDPETGAALLIGTVREGGEAMPLGRRAAVFDLLPTRLGAALLPRADMVTMVAMEGRFIAAGVPGAPLALSPEAPIATDSAARMSRSFDLPRETTAALQERARNATAAVAAAAPLARGQPRLRNAEALLALGLPQEAQSMLALAMREDPRLGEDPRTRALHGAAALLGGRVSEAGGLDRPAPETDELSLWRGLLAAARGQGGAGAVAAALPLLLSYPEPLLARLAPMAAEALAAGGETAAARRLVAAREGDEAALALASARLREAEGDIDGALEGYDALARGRDRRARALAMRRAAELRLANGRIDAAAAAAALEATLAAWRGDASESEGRIRLAELRVAAGDPRGAFDMLRETEALFPALSPQLKPRQADALLGAIAHDAPVAAVALFDAHADLLPAGEATEQALASLAERLAALDLVDRAAHVLRRAAARAAGPEPRARLGAQLATLALGAGDSTAALAALEETAASGLPMPLRQERSLLEARALARAGRGDDAIARYRDAGVQAAPELAALLSERQDWHGAAAAMLEHLRVVLPPAPEPLEAAQRPLVARTAALLALAGDESGLAALRAHEQARMAGGPLEEAFGVITAARVEGMEDLPRLRQELDLARLLPTRLEALRQDAPTTR